MAHTALIAAGIILSLLYQLYRWALPKPIPGIPYNKESAGRLLGDVPSLVADIKRRGDVFLWFRDQNLQSGSVINQVFTNLLGKPVVIVADARETRDILVHRSADFDRTVFVSNLLRPIIGQGQITFPTGPAWKARRRLSQDTMSARFLKNVAAPNIHSSCAVFVRLWEEKARLAAGRPFDAETDLFHATLDAVTVFTFGSQYPYRAVRPRLEALAALSAGDVERGPRADDPAVFPRCEIDTELQNIIDFIERAEAVQSMGLQDLGWYFETMTGRYRTLKRAKDECVRREVSRALERMKALDERTAEETARHGVDLIVNRERIMAGKENRQPDYFGEAVRGEVFGAIVGGHDTSSSTMCWAVKLLSREQATQTALRRALQSAYAAALEERRQPTVEEVLDTPLPYLDATIEELFRTCAVVPMNSRQATRDTEVLGRPIPKGTVVMHLSAGPGFTMPSYPVDDKLRHSSGGKEAAAWADDDVEAFRPERWLVDGAERCDPNAGPSNGFGMGIRSCFGKRLAYMSFRLLLVSVVWKFEMLECPEELSSPLGKFGVVYKPQQTYVRLRKVAL
ncbi:Cytochrome P450 [Cordyceps fumosorosea ARSEF 2679]|uniref:Cytochrome P450 n=1 Tax=Cordyceps fumosorosea (strain ARSEF 2679) TaxID=1081104 RepID=A0A168B518_CORFA|nr:Cytochrome P450 [Cordyceps fumosorosea ARSEF 2679]OAA69627.1 Cytochrome P450 [Cordyceps fumosorosea ARSEF 2679]